MNYTIRRVLEGERTKEVTVDWWMPAKTVTQVVAEDGTIVQSSEVEHRVVALVDAIAVPLDADDAAILAAVEARRVVAAKHWKATKGGQDPNGVEGPNAGLIGATDA